MNLSLEVAQGPLIVVASGFAWPSFVDALASLVIARSKSLKRAPLGDPRKTSAAVRLRATKHEVVPRTLAPTRRRKEREVAGGVPTTLPEDRRPNPLRRFCFLKPIMLGSGEPPLLASAVTRSHKCSNMIRLSAFVALSTMVTGRSCLNCVGLRPFGGNRTSMHGNRSELGASGRGDSSGWLCWGSSTLGAAPLVSALAAFSPVHWGSASSLGGASGCTHGSERSISVFRHA